MPHLEPLYRAERIRAAYQLRYSWTAWPSVGTFPVMPPDLLAALAPFWEADGLRVLEHRWQPDAIQITFSTKPRVAPVFLASRAKGRLQYALRQARLRTRFSRKVSVRSVGENTRADVERYIANQAAAARFVDPRFRAEIERLVVRNADVNLSQPSESAHGRYWYNLHLVLAVAGRDPIVDRATLDTLRQRCCDIARKKGYAISRLAVMPDHIHAALRGNIGESPQDIATAFLNNLAFAVGQKRIWADGYYAGTFSEYGMAAVRPR